MSRKTLNLVGLKFGKWLVGSKGKNINHKTTWKCICECGSVKEVYACHLIANKSNGCLDCAVKTHGMTKTATHQSWVGMKSRCLNKSHMAYHRYGGRGITIEPNWLDFQSFLNDMGIRPKGLTLDRIDNNGNYFKENCRWATKKEQSNNSKQNKYVIHNLKKYTFSELADKLNVKYPTLYSQIQRGSRKDVFLIK